MKRLEYVQNPTLWKKYVKQRKKHFKEQGGSTDQQLTIDVDAPKEGQKGEETEKKIEETRTRAHIHTSQMCA